MVVFAMLSSAWSSIATLRCLGVGSHSTTRFWTSYTFMSGFDCIPSLYPCTMDVSHVGRFCSACPAPPLSLDRAEGSITDPPMRLANSNMLFFLPSLLLLLRSIFILDVKEVSLRRGEPKALLRLLLAVVLAPVPLFPLFAQPTTFLNESPTRVLRDMALGSTITGSASVNFSSGTMPCLLGTSCWSTRSARSRALLPFSPPQ
mmetsp:Transcript_38200/g.107943  ORF Transcript_38200/g.107943 Transcript_38200/m.107943 type:complete len:203 (+) Transcript_38200:429-1037(+)